MLTTIKYLLKASNTHFNMSTMGRYNTREEAEAGRKTWRTARPELRHWALYKETTTVVTEDLPDFW